MTEPFIEAYLTAFRQATPEKTPPVIKAEEGEWFTFRYQGATHKLRKMAIEEMTMRLLAKAKNPGVSWTYRNRSKMKAV